MYTIELKKAQNAYYCVIRQAKKVCWQKILLEENGKLDSPLATDKNRYWTTLRYTKPLQFKTTFILKDNNGNTAISMKVKEALVHKAAFPPPPNSSIQ